MSGEKKQIGRILLKRRLISQEELDKQLEKQKTSQDGVPLASRLASGGFVKETEVLRALSEQFGVPGIDLNQITIATEHLDLVPREMAESSKILPVLVKDDRLFLAMANPRDKRVIDELEFVTGRRVYPYVAITTTLDKATQAAYDAKDAGETIYVGREAPSAEVPAPRRPTPPPIAPVGHGVVVDEQIEEAGAEGAISTSDFGTYGEEISKVETMSDELRAAAGMAPVPKTRGTGKRILVVDDEEDIRRLVRKLLTDQGHEVIEADRGLVALRFVKEHQPDLILLDAMLPELHGFDIARRIKGSDRYGQIPVLMMSAVYRGWRIAEDLKSSYGIEDYIEKPFSLKDLLAKVTRLLEREKETPPADPEKMTRSAAKYLEDGINAYKAGNIEQAIDLLRKGISVDPLAYRLRYHLALVYGKQGQIYEGITELERAVDLNPKHFAALKNLAVLYEKAGFRHKAVEMWERSVHVAPDAETRASIKAHLVKLL